MRALVAAAGVDYRQWAALSRAYLITDYATMLGAYGAAEARRAILSTLIMAVATTFFSFGPVAVILFSRDGLFAATLMTTSIALVVAFTVLAQAASIVAPDDQDIIGCRPISSRTYFAVRATALLINTCQAATLIGWAPVAAFWFRSGSLAIALAAFAASAATALTVACAALTAYAWLMRRVSPGRLARAVAYANMAAVVVLMGGYGLGMAQWMDRAAVGPLTIDVAMPRSPWTLFYPPMWFASYVEIAAGTAGTLEVLAAGLSIAVLLGLALALRGRISADYAARVADIAVDTTTGASTWRSVPRFLRGETRAVAILVKCQLQSDLSVQVNVLMSLVMLALFFVAGAWGELPRDPFFVPLALSTRHSTFMSQFALLFIGPMLYQTILTSATHGAAWFFFSAPADRVTIVRATRDLVFLVVLLPILALMAAFFAFAYGHIGHALLQTAFVGGLTYVMLELGVLARPRFPFSTPVAGRRGFGGGALMAILGTLTVPLILLLNLYVYRTPARVAVGIAGLAAIIIMLDRLTGRRIRARADLIEYVA